MRLEIIWQINNFNVAIASHTYMFSIGAPGAGPQEWCAQLWSKCWSCHSATGRQQFMIKQKMTHQDDSIECNPWWNSALFRLSHEERTTMDSSVPLWPAHCAQFVCKLWAAAICEDWNCPDPSDWNNKDRHEDSTSREYLLQFLAHEIWILTSETTAPQPLPTSETMQTGAATKIAESFEWRKDVIGTDS